MIEEIITEAYEVFTRKVHDLPTFKFNPSDRERKQIENFVELLKNRYDGNSIGRQFIFNFFTFSYEYWSGLDHSSKKRIPLNWIIGKKAIDKWVHRNEDDLYHANKYVTDLGIHIGLIKSGKNSKRDDVSTLKVNEEYEKERFYNTGTGFVNCLEATTLFNDKSKFCQGCNMNEVCKEKLRKLYPKIFIARGYLDI